MPVSTQGFEEVVNMPQIYTVHAPGKIHFMIPGRIGIGANQRDTVCANPILYFAQGIKKISNAYQIYIYLREYL
jgi:hypothetical protein